MPLNTTRWRETKLHNDPADDRLLPIIEAVRALPEANAHDIHAILRRYPKHGGGGSYSKHHIIHAYRRLCDAGEIPFERETLRRLQMKPTRTISGVAPVTVLTKPYPCPGQCIFCPTDVRMPKSYLRDEPGAMRAEQHAFDPYAQTFHRIRSFSALGHGVSKIELLILGGTWSSYRRDYQEWFVQRCLDAMNGRDSRSLAEAQKWNESAPHRNVGLVIETRPDHIDWNEIKWLRMLGVTKVQMGAQSLSDRILQINKRGHTVEQTREAVNLLRAAGFKIALHWMPNLLGATPDSDREDFMRLWSDPALRPDELKIYPCSLLANAELYEYWRRGEHRPYADDELLELVADCMTRVPRYCRVNRVIRDIPAPNIVAGSTRSNLRQDAERLIRERGLRDESLRAREVRGANVRADDLRLETIAYETSVGAEHFISFVTSADKVAGFVRLSLPAPTLDPSPVAELRDGGGEGVGVAMIRELHIYGPALSLGDDSSGEAQHLGLGARLLSHTEQIAIERGYKKIAVISAIGTREYYRKRGFEVEGLYMTKRLASTWK
ncbi:MAG: tRNA uridine(34) 5-carboxymethylaminomethyl modification radical SAM/GNAT enzyme Elp3 [Chloroflexi bacterium]|nr:tRNA uridine(34) 5-carboxymethylaminomethyl modification radical SAM/GNAT enzyme Elp3 [Chloroflexota bacterium]